jgi:hypothetical protein
MQRGTNHVEQSSDENGRKSARNKTMRRGTNHAEQKNKRNGQKLVRNKTMYTEQICETMEQMKKENDRFFVQNSPTSEADQNFDQFISPSRPKYCTKS